MNDHLKFSSSIYIIIITHQEQNYDLLATRIWKFSCSSWWIWCSIVPRIIPLSGVKERDSFSFVFKSFKRSLALEKRLRSSSCFRVFSALASKRIMEAYKKTWQDCKSTGKVTGIIAFCIKCYVSHVIITRFDEERNWFRCNFMFTLCYHLS